MIKHLFIALAVVMAAGSVAMAKDNNLRKIQAKVVDVRFCSPERESVCVKTDKGPLALMSPFSGAIDDASFNELFHMLHVFKDGTVELILVEDHEIIGIKTQGYEFIAPETDMKTLTPRKMP